MNTRSETSLPRFVLNVGDNFYWAGIDSGGQYDCGSPSSGSNAIIENYGGTHLNGDTL